MINQDENRIPTAAAGRVGRAAVVVGSLLTIASCGESSGPGGPAGRLPAVWSDAVTLDVWKPRSGNDGPALGVDSAGNALAVWERDEETTVDVVASRFEPASGWSAPEIIGRSIEDTAAENGRRGARAPRLAVAADGSALVAWIRVDARGSSLALRRYLPVEGWTEVMLPGSGEAGGEGANSVRISSDGQGRALLVWGAGGRVWAEELSSESGWAAATVVAAALTEDRFYGIGLNDVDIGADGTAIVIWVQSYSDGLRVAGALRSAFRADGYWGEAEYVSLARGYGEPFLAGVDGHGTALLGWQGFSLGYGDLDPRSGLRDADGWTDSIQIAPLGYKLLDVAQAPDGSRLAFLVEKVGLDMGRLSSRTFDGTGEWHDERPIAPGDSTRVNEGWLGIGSDGTALALWLAGSSLQSARIQPSGDWADPLTIGETCGDARPAVVVDDAGSATALWATCGELRASRLGF